MKKLTRKSVRWGFVAGLVLAIASLAGCNLLNTPTGTTANVFAVDSKNGSVYEIDTDTNESASVALVSTAQNSTGEMVIHGSKAFLAVGSYSNTAPGLYWFSLSSQTPSAQKIGSGISAQYLCVASDTAGYVSSADYYGVYSNAVYPFDLSDPSAGLGEAVTGFDAGFYPQDIAFAGDSGDGRVFVTDNANSRVYRLTADGSAVDRSFSTSAGGPTGLLPGNYDWDNNGTEDAGVFVANTGGYDASWNALPGSIDFIPLDATSGSDIVCVQSDLSVGRLAAFDTTHLIATNYGGTWIIDLTKPTGDSGRLTEVKNASDASFGSCDVNIYDGYAYVPDGSQTVYKIGVSGGFTAISVGKSGEMITNVAVKE